MKYDRKIRYFDYMEKGERIRNGGFVKLELRDGICYVSIQVSGVPVIDNTIRDVYVLAGDREEKLGEIRLQQGKGCMQLNRDSEKLCVGSGYHGIGSEALGYDELEAIRIPIAVGRELFCRVADQYLRKSQPVEEPEPQEDNALPVEEPELQEDNALPVKNEEPQEGNTLLMENKELQETEVLSGEGKESQRKEVLTLPLQEDKWKQLSSIYPHIAPFQDDREYLSIGPGDFVIFTQKYYRLVNNSFLLHGFYNYKHLILKRMEKRNEIVYYIGVPGNFYDREKQVAVMFGFESFECREEPADNGDYGYYMMRVEI